MDVLAHDSLALVLLAAIVVGLAYLGREIARLRADLEPLATSPLARVVAGL